MPEPDPASTKEEIDVPDPPVLDASAATNRPPRPRGSAQSQSSTYFVSGFWRRLAAAGLDLGIILPIAGLLCWVAGSITGLSLPPSRLRGLDFWLDLLLASDSTLIGALGLTLSIAATYSLIFHISLGHTLGMRVLKLRIIDVYGDAPAMPRALLRTLGYVLCVATVGLGFIWIAFDSEKRGLHDWLAGTYVVKS